jgi:DASS family divalent anion:Na+ symporter
MINPLPIGAIAMLSILAATLTNTLTIEQAVGGFGNQLVWMVVFSFFISRGFIKTGLGRRIAYYFISKFGHSTLGLSYSLVITEFLLAPMIPSVTARGGGIIFPIAKSLAEEYSIQENKKGGRSKTAAFIIQVCFQASVITSAMFITAMASNALIVKLAGHHGIEISWKTWALGALVPGITSLVLIPLLLYKVCPPTIKALASAPKQAKEALANMGRISSKEIMMLITFFFLITCWILDKNIGMNATTTAMLGFSILLITRILSWQDALSESGAWDTLAWFATLVMLSDYVTKFGMTEWMGKQMEILINPNMINLSLALLVLFYFYIHYIFASVTAHITVLYATFLLLLIGFGMPPLASALILGYFSSLSGGLTHFGIGSAPVFYESHYLSTKEWWQMGGIVSIINVLIWTVVGALWWKVLGWW